MFHYCFGMIGTGHKSGYVYQDRPKHYLLMHFRNDFFIEVDGKTIQSRGGSFVLHAPNKPVAHGAQSKREGFINDWLFFDADGEEAAFLSQLPMDRPIPAENPEIFTHSLSRIISENLRNDPHSRRLMSGLIYQMLVELSRAHQLQQQKQTNPDTRFEGYRRYFREHCQQPWDLQKMAAHAGYSPSHFSARYKAILGISPMEDLLCHRLQLAQRLLSLKTYQVSEVAQLCGFSSLHYFSEFFKKRTGRSPSAY